MRQEDDIREVMEDEKGRGRRQPGRSASRKVRQERKKTVRELLAIRDRNEFVAAIIEYGLRPGSAEFETALKAWREFDDT
jgi:hypothetical protein